MNPAELLRLKSDLKTFESDHPKFPAFVRYAADRGLREGTVVEVVLRQPDRKVQTGTLRETIRDARFIAPPLAGVAEVLHGETVVLPNTHALFRDVVQDEDGFQLVGEYDGHAIVL